MSFATASVWSKIALFFLVLAFVLHIVGFATTAWFTMEITWSHETHSSEISSYHGGLWELCSCEETTCICVKFTIVAGWLRTVQVLESIGLGLLFICGITCVVELCGKSNTKRNINRIFLQLIVSGIFIGIGVAVYRTETGKLRDSILQGLSQYGSTGLRLSLGYSSILCAVACAICLFVCLPLLIYDKRLNNHADVESAISLNNREMIPYPAVTFMDGQHLLPSQSHVTIQNTMLESSRQVYGKQLQYPNHDQVVALQGKACVGDQYPPTTPLYVSTTSLL